MPDQALEIRPVDFTNRNDVALYLDLLDAYARDPMGAGKPLSANVRKRLAVDLPDHPGVRGLLAVCGDQAVGFATCFLGYSTFRAQPLLNVHDIAVLPAWRGRSNACALLDAIADLGRQLDCCRITLEVREDNQRARGVYEKAGFAPGQCSLFMEKSL